MIILWLSDSKLDILLQWDWEPENYGAGRQHYSINYDVVTKQQSLS